MGFADGPKVRTLEGVVADDVAGGGFADDGVQLAAPVELLDAVGDVEVRVRIGPPIGLVDPSRDLEPVFGAVVADLVLAGLVRMVQIGVLRVLLLQAVLDGLQHVDGGVRAVNAQVELRARCALLDPPQPIECGSGTDASGNVAAHCGRWSVIGHAVPERDAVLEDLELQGHRVDLHRDLELHHGVALSREGVLDEGQAGQEGVAQSLELLALKVRQTQGMGGEVPRERFEFREAWKGEAQFEVVERLGHNVNTRQLQRIGTITELFDRKFEYRIRSVACLFYGRL
jgi:hypothetical protein